MVIKPAQLVLYTRITSPGPRVGIDGDSIYHQQALGIVSTISILGASLKWCELPSGKDTKNFRRSPFV